MTKQRVSRTVFWCGSMLGLAAACACSSSNSDAHSNQASSAVNVCEAPESVPMVLQNGCSLASATYEAGMAQKGSSGLLTFQIVSATGGAIAQGDWTWNIKITDANCAPVADATVKVNAWMPQHSHGWAYATVSSSGGGAYEVDNLNLFMDGFWQITFTATATLTNDAGASESVTDSTVFSFCLDQ
jgi:hypothetical protein